jgi:hypothetical protein
LSHGQNGQSAQLKNLALLEGWVKFRHFYYMEGVN